METTGSMWSTPRKGMSVRKLRYARITASRVAKKAAPKE